MQCSEPLSSMRRKVLAKLSPRWKERVIPCSLKVTAFIWGFYSVLGSWLKNTKHSYYPLGWHESDTVPIRNISLKILHLSTVCIKSKIHSCAEGNTKLMNLSMPWKWLKWCIVQVWCREGFHTRWTPVLLELPAGAARLRTALLGIFIPQSKESWAAAPPGLGFGSDHAQLCLGSCPCPWQFCLLEVGMVCWKLGSCMVH